MIIVRLHAEVDTLIVTRLLSRLDEVLREKLTLLVEIVTSSLEDYQFSPSFRFEFDRSLCRIAYHIDEHLQRSFPLLHKLCRVMLLPLLLLVLAEIAFERFLTPWAVDRICDWRKGRYRFVHARVLKELIELLAYASRENLKQHTSVKAPCPPML